MATEIKKILTIIESKLDWGEGNSWQSKDFENLNQRILDETGVSLSASTLRRIWGRVEYNHLPSTTTLDALAKFGGYENWRSFTKGNNAPILDASNHEMIPGIKEREASQKNKIIVSILLLLLIVIGIFSALRFNSKTTASSNHAYAFSSKVLAHGLPNSVVFTYDASNSPTDSIFIQQSWDPNTRIPVDKNMHQHTSIYYEPGYYDAKLIVGNKIEKEHTLLIPTDGWLGVVKMDLVPVYFQSSEFIHQDFIGISIENLIRDNISLQPKTPLIKYSNIGNFSPISLSDFNFSADIKNDYKDGSAACQFSTITLITDDQPIAIPLSIKGCVSELNLSSVDQKISGKNTDLSIFGVDFSDWIHVSCKSNAGYINYYVNDQLAYKCPLPQKQVNIVGMQFNFEGTGRVKHILLGDNTKVVYKAF